MLPFFNGTPCAHCRLPMLTHAPEFYVEGGAEDGEPVHGCCVTGAQRRIIRDRQQRMRAARANRPATPVGGVEND